MVTTPGRGSLGEWLSFLSAHVTNKDWAPFWPSDDLKILAGFGEKKKS